MSGAASGASPFDGPGPDLPASADDHPWPTIEWSTGPGPPDAERVLDEAFSDNPNPDLALSLATVVIHRGRLVSERYGPGTDASTRLLSWSTAKSFTHAAVGLALLDGVLDLHAPGVAPEWADPCDPRHAITLDQLLAMRSGLEFNEDYTDSDTSHCLEMLFGAGAADTARYAASQPLIAPPGRQFNYSSGTTNIVSRAVAAALGGGREVMQSFLADRLFSPLGMGLVEPRFDEAGTFVGSSYLFATARDFARFGELYLRDGMWGGRRLLPEGWVDHGRTPRSVDSETGDLYGCHWWVWDDDLGTFGARGYEGQYIICVPALDLVVVRLGKSPIEHREHVLGWLGRLIDTFR